MENKIRIGNSEFILDINDEYIGELIIWGKATKVFLDMKGNEENLSNIVIEKIDWLNTERNRVIDVFMEENDHYVDVINEMIEHGDFKSDKKISVEDFVKALFINNVAICIKGNETDFCLDLEADPDYLLGHLAFMEIDSQYGVEFGGMNG